MMRYLYVLLFIFTCLGVQAKKINVLLVTGGHGFDTIQFFQMFDGIKEISYKSVWQPEANKMIALNEAGKYDLLVFYDMWEPISGEEKEGYLKLTHEGKPMLFLHHSLCSYQKWPEFEKLLGGKYVQKGPDVPPEQLSTYKHDEWVDIEAVDRIHPVVRGLKQFRLFDEVYGNFRVGDQVKPFLKTTHKESTPVIGWENRYNASKIIYLQPGHDKNSFENGKYRKLIRQSINYLAK